MLASSHRWHAATIGLPASAVLAAEQTTGGRWQRDGCEPPPHLLQQLAALQHGGHAVAGIAVRRVPLPPVPQEGASAAVNPLRLLPRGGTLQRLGDYWMAVPLA